MSNGEPCYWNTILFVRYSFILRNYKQNKDDLISSHLAKFMPRDLIPSVLSWDPNMLF